MKLGNQVRVGDLSLVKMVTLRLRVMPLILNIIFSGMIVILAYKSTTFRFTSLSFSVMNKNVKD